MTPREQIAAGPRFTLATTPDGKNAPAADCACCGWNDYLDRETGLCRACFRAWRFSEGAKGVR